MSSHTEEKPYHCSHCDKAFSQNSTFLRHLNTHTGENPYHCRQYGTNNMSEPKVEVNELQMESEKLTGPIVEVKEEQINSDTHIVSEPKVVVNCN